VSDCLFCRMVAGEIPADVVHETDRVFAFRDINPQAPTHVLVIPKEHHRNIAAQEGLVDVDPVDGGTAEPGYRLVTNTGPEAGQSVDHVHLHVLGGRRMGWPPG
jgi:histidine triad (HIT) family protein